MAGEVHEFSGSCFFLGWGGMGSKDSKVPQDVGMVGCEWKVWYSILYVRFFCSRVCPLFFFFLTEGSKPMVDCFYILYVFYLSNK